MRCTICVMQFWCRSCHPSHLALVKLKSLCCYWHPLIHGKHVMQLVFVELITQTIGQQNRWVLQDGRQGARVFARKHFLSEQALDMLADMRWQFACMLADSKLTSGNPGNSRGRDWMDDPKQPCNVHASKQAVVHIQSSADSLQVLQSAFTMYNPTCCASGF